MGNYDANTIRSTYPVYDDLDPNYSKSIFINYASPGTQYMPFIGWRRHPYKSNTVNIDDEHRTRLSLNQKAQQSTWFFGGSTMWGTGSDDNQTIPSWFAKISGETVWNFGESGFNSFQELNQLMIYLVKGYKPKRVIFYDGVNEGYYCNTNNKEFPTHAKSEKFKKYIANYRKVLKSNRELKKEVNKIISTGEYKKGAKDSLIYRISNYIYRPYINLYYSAIDKRSIGIEMDKSLKSDIPFKDFNRKGKYKNCGRSDKKLKEASLTTVRTWLIVNDILKEKKIDFFVFLQPTSQINPEALKLDYIRNPEKQRIVDEHLSYLAQYSKIKQNWYKECEKHQACDKFYDLSDIFDSINKNIYIDAVHISPEGNRIVAEKIWSIINNSIN